LQFHSFSDQTAADASLVDVTGKEEATQPLPWRVSGSEEQTISKEKIKQFSNIAQMKTYDCKTCNKKFASRLTLEKHQKTHSMHWCKDCHYEFCSRLNLQLPAGNSGTSVYICEICKSNFSNVVQLRTHITRFHWRQKPYSCDQCIGVAASNSDVQQMPNKCLVCEHKIKYICAVHITCSVVYWQCSKVI
jgi:DNA-directed RNA polymerase subunit RPC12/RpoP